MSLRPSALVLVGLIGGVAAFVWQTSRGMPAVVASHFGANGAADGFMSRGAYVATILFISVGTPLLVGFLPVAAAGKQGQRLNIPNREYWLADERRDATVAFVRLHGRWFAGALVVFLGYTHWLVVRANTQAPPVLSTVAMMGGLGVFFAYVAGWLMVLFVRFRRPGPRASHASTHATHP